MFKRIKIFQIFYYFERLYIYLIFGTLSPFGIAFWVCLLSGEENQSPYFILMKHFHSKIVEPILYTTAILHPSHFIIKVCSKQLLAPFKQENIPSKDENLSLALCHRLSRQFQMETKFCQWEHCWSKCSISTGSHLLVKRLVWLGTGFIFQRIFHFTMLNIKVVRKKFVCFSKL